MEVLAEWDVEKKLANMDKSPTAKRLEQQAQLEKQLRLEFRAQHEVKMAQLRVQARAKREAEHRAAEEAVTRYVCVRVRI